MTTQPESKVCRGDALIEHLNSLHLRLTARYKAVQDLDVDIFDRLPDANKDTDSARQYEYEEKVYITLQKIQTRRDAYNKSLIVPPVQPITVAPPRDDHVNFSKFLNLPKTNVPVIPKDITKYLSWVDQFNSTIHDQKCLTEVQKLQYLRQACNPNHASIIEHIETAGGGNYERARQTIEERLYNPRAIAYSLISSFLTTPVIKPDNGQSILHFTELVKGMLADLEKLGVDTEGWDVLLMCVITDKLDEHTKREYLTKYPSKQLPELDHCMQFLEERGLALNTLHKSTVAEKKPNTNQNNQNNKRNNGGSLLNQQIVATASLAAAAQSLADAKSSWNSQKKQAGSGSGGGGAPPQVKNDQPRKSVCTHCGEGHWTNRCPAFLALSPQERHASIKGKNGCFNCLGSRHPKEQCPLKGTCKECQKPHNTLLHFPPKVAPPAHHAVDDGKTVTLLGTAIVPCVDSKGTIQLGRALIDTGSSLNMVTAEFAAKLDFKPKPCNFKIGTVGNNNPQQSKGTVDFNITTTEGQSVAVHALILDQCTGKLPMAKVNVEMIAELAGKKLADPAFHTPAPVDMILGIELFNTLMLNERIRCGRIVLSETRLGWMLTGVAQLADVGMSAHVSPFIRPSVHHATLMPPIESCLHAVSGKDAVTEPVLLDEEILKFWTVEDLPGSNLLAKPEQDYNPEEQFVSDHYTRTTTLTDDGHYVVKLPKKPAELTGGVELVLGDSEPRATKSLLGQEKSCDKLPAKRVFYNGFMQAYIDHGHLVKVDPALLAQLPNECKFYLPHHAVEKESTTTPFRVVVNGSARSSSGVSLNDTLAVGPTLQPQLVVTLIAFQMHVYAFTGDISKMYRQIHLHESERFFHLVLWRFDTSSPIETYCMHRVSYGVTSSCYHAVRTLQEIAKRSVDASKEVKDAIINDFYVDDLMTGAATEEGAKSLLEGMIKTLGDAGFPIRKFASNCSHLVTELPPELRENEDAFDVSSPDHFTHSLKILGVRWLPAEDCFVFLINHVEFTEKEVRIVTKRQLLADIMKLFDPTGFMAPVTLLLKAFMQTTWEQGLGWDEPLPKATRDEFLEWRAHLVDLRSVRVPRCLLPKGIVKSIQLHVYCDASETGYGACVYIRAVNEEGKVHTRLVMAKARVSPVKQQSIPRLELLGATIGVKLFRS